MASDKQLTILYLEDDKDFRDFIVKILIKNGFEVIGCRSATMAKEALEKHKIDLIISDISLKYREEETVEGLIRTGLEMGIGIILYTGAIWDDLTLEFRNIELVKKGDENDLEKLLCAIKKVMRKPNGKKEALDGTFTHNFAKPDRHIETPVEKLLDNLMASKEQTDKLMAYREFLEKDIRKAGKEGYLSRTELDSLIRRRDEISARLKQ